MTSIMSRSQGRKSWSMIRSTPAAANRRTVSRAWSGVPATHRSRRFPSHAALVLAGGDRVGHGGQPGGKLPPRPAR